MTHAQAYRGLKAQRRAARGTVNGTELYRFYCQTRNDSRHSLDISQSESAFHANRWPWRPSPRPQGIPSVHCSFRQPLAVAGLLQSENRVTQTHQRLHPRAPQHRLGTGTTVLVHRMSRRR